MTLKRFSRVPSFVLTLLILFGTAAGPQASQSQCTTDLCQCDGACNLEQYNSYCVTSYACTYFGNLCTEYVDWVIKPAPSGACIVYCCVIYDRMCYCF